jgi:DNA (cytosine-5)-methyltransferase 1
VVCRAAVGGASKKVDSAAITDLIDDIKMRHRVNKDGFIVNGHMINPYKPRKFATARRLAVDDTACPSIISGGVVPGNDAPFIKPSSAGCKYADMLSEEFPNNSLLKCGMRLASFFCGCGGLDLGFRSAGFELSFATDYYTRACETYEHNLGHAPLCANIRNIQGNSNQAFTSIDVLAGGFPCVTFSMAGKRAGVEDSTNGMLYLELCRMIREIKPRYFVAENVKGILSANGGRAILLVLAEFLRLGYKVEYKLVNMAKYGVPQTRERIIFFGQRLDQVRGSFRFPKETHRLVSDRTAPGWLPLARTLREAIGDLPEPEIVRQLDTNPKNASAPRASDPAFSVRASGSTRCEVVAASGGENAYIVKARIHNRTISNRNAQRFRTVDEPSPVPTSTHPCHVAVCDHDKLSGAGETSFGVAERGGNHDMPSPVVAAGAGSGVLWKDIGLRRMTVRECARVQSFPDWFEFMGSMSDGYRQVGNAVPPLYAKRLAEAILEHDARRIIG